MITHSLLRRLVEAAGLGIALLVLAGCAGTQNPPALFVLEAGASAPDNAPQPGAPTLMIAPVTAASYLDQGGIVYRTGPHRVVIANNNRWASPLSGQLTDALYATLERRLAGVNVVHDDNREKNVYQLQTRIAQFLGDYTGKAHIAGRWTLIGPNGKTLAASTFKKTIPLAADGYPALVASLSHGWQAVARSMTPRLAKALH